MSRPKAALSGATGHGPERRACLRQRKKRGVSRATRRGPGAMSGAKRRKDAAARCRWPHGHRRGPSLRCVFQPSFPGAWWPVAQGDKGVNDLSLPFVTGPEGFFRTFEMQGSIARVERINSLQSNLLDRYEGGGWSRHPVLPDSGNGPRESAWLSASPAWLQLQRIDAFSSQRGVPLASLGYARDMASLPASAPFVGLSIQRWRHGQTRGHRPQAARGTLILKRRGGG